LMSLPTTTMTPVGIMMVIMVIMVTMAIILMTMYPLQLLTLNTLLISTLMNIQQQFLHQVRLMNKKTCHKKNLKWDQFYNSPRLTLV
jgi:hypothetical protein